MSAQVTEAHKQLVATIVEQAFRFAEGNHKITPLSQLIADSEAKAVAEWQDFVHLKGEAIDSLLLECDRLRAEVERLKRDYDYDHKCLHEVRERCELWKQRAERAEAELHALRLICGTTDADRFSTWVDRANARAEKAEAELATERARLDWFADYGDTCWHDQTMGVLRGEDSAEFYADSFRAAIDAAMKEGA